VLNAPERVEVPKKTTPPPSIKKRVRAEITRKDTALEKRPRTEKSKAPTKFKNVIQPGVEQHHMNANDPQSSSQVRYTNETRISEIPNDLVLENHEASNGIEEIFLNYISGKLCDHNTTIANLCFSTALLKNVLTIQILIPWQSVRNTQTGTS
jgi:hypothetical protein